MNINKVIKLLFLFSSLLIPHFIKKNSLYNLILFYGKTSPHFLIFGSASIDLSIDLYKFKQALNNTNIYC